jgi:hypothetical protein
LPYDEFVWRAFFMNKGLDACSFLYVKWAVVFPEESFTVKTSLVVTHYMFGFFSPFTWVECCWLCLWFVDLFDEVWLIPSFARLKWNLAHWLFCWSQYGQRNNKTKMAGQTSCVL